MFWKFLFSAFFFVFIAQLSIAQVGKITGKVLNAKTGEVLIGATVSIEGKSKSTQTDQNGNYTLSGLVPGEYTVNCSYVSFVPKKMPGIKVQANEVTVQDVVLEMKGNIGEIVIKSPGSNKPKETVSSILVAQKNSASVSDGISAETIKRTPDRNTGDILKRVSGASLQEDKFAVVRGLNDRYNAAYLNGAPLPSSESDRKAFAFDMFPSNMLDNLIIYKTATPDMPGEFAGGQIVINTKGIPSENFQTFSFGLGVNTISTFRQKKYYEGGSLDFIGLDTKRKLNASVPDIATFKQLSINERVAYSKTFEPRGWGFLNKNTVPNTSLQYIIGKNIQRKEKDFLGMIFSVTYTKTLTRNAGDRIFYAPEYDNAPQRVYQEETFNTQTLLGAIANFSLKLNNNNNFSFKNIFSINAEDRLITRDGKDDIINEPDRYTKSYALWFTSNRIYSTQVIGEHYLPSTKLKVNWLASYSDIMRTVPALRRMVFDSVAGAPTYLAKLFDPNPVDNDNTAGLTFYSTNKEKVYNAKVDFSRTFKLFKSVQTLFKSGVYYQTRDRVFDPRLLAFCNFNTSTFDQSLLTQSPDVLFNKKNIGYFPSGKTGFVLKDITEIRDRYTAGTELFAYYGMADQRFGKWLRLIYGVRVESFHQTLNADFNQFTPVRLNTRKTDVLPSANVVISLDNRQNIRLCYSKTVNRPEFRELAPFLFRDYTIRYSVFGDTSLRRAAIQNYDIRYEFFPGKAQLISVSGFFKQFTDPIELISVSNLDRTLSYRNTPSAQIIGLEMEIRTVIGSMLKVAQRSMLNNLTFFGNFTLLKSKVDLKTTEVTNFYYKQGRVMQGQSPYVINAGFTYQDDQKNFSSTISVNRYGQRIFLASNGDMLQNGTLIEPNLWENGRTQIDFQLTKAFPKKRMDFRINVKDILAQKLVFFEDTNNNAKYDAKFDALRSSAQFGRVITVACVYKF